MIFVCPWAIANTSCKSIALSLEKTSIFLTTTPMTLFTGCSYTLLEKNVLFLLLQSKVAYKMAYNTRTTAVMKSRYKP